MKLVECRNVYCRIGFILIRTDYVFFKVMDLSKKYRHNESEQRYVNRCSAPKTDGNEGAIS